MTDTITIDMTDDTITIDMMKLNKYNFNFGWMTTEVNLNIDDFKYVISETQTTNDIVNNIRKKYGKPIEVSYPIINDEYIGRNNGASMFNKDNNRTKQNDDETKQNDDETNKDDDETNKDDDETNKDDDETNKDDDETIIDDDDETNKDDEPIQYNGIIDYYETCKKVNPANSIQNTSTNNLQNDEVIIKSIDFIKQHDCSKYVERLNNSTKFKICEKVRNFKMFVIIRCLFLIDQLHDFTSNRSINNLNLIKISKNLPQEKKKIISYLTSLYKKTIIQNLGNQCITDCYEFLNVLFNFRVENQNEDQDPKKHLRKLIITDAILFKGDTFFLLLFNFINKCIEYDDPVVEKNSNKRKRSNNNKFLDLYKISNKIIKILGYYKQNVYNYISFNNDMNYYCKQSYSYLRLFLESNAKFNLSKDVTLDKKSAIITVDTDKSKFGTSDILKEICNTLSDNNSIEFYKSLSTIYDASTTSGTEKVLQDFININRIKNNNIKSNLNIINNFNQENFIIKIGDYEIINFKLSKVESNDIMLNQTLIDDIILHGTELSCEQTYKIKQEINNFKLNFYKRIAFVYDFIINRIKNSKIKLAEKYIIYTSVDTNLIKNESNINELKYKALMKILNINLSNIKHRNIKPIIKNLVDSIKTLYNKLNNPIVIHDSVFSRNNIYDLTLHKNLVKLIFKAPKDFNDVNNEIINYVYNNSKEEINYEFSVKDVIINFINNFKIEPTLSISKFFQTTNNQQHRNSSVSSVIKNILDIATKAINKPSNMTLQQTPSTSNMTLQQTPSTSNMTLQQTPSTSNMTLQQTPSGFVEFKNAIMPLLTSAEKFKKEQNVEFNISIANYITEHLSNDLTIFFAYKTLGDFSQIVSFMNYKKDKHIVNKFFITFDIICANISCLFNHGTLFEESGNNLSPLIPYSNIFNNDSFKDTVITLAQMHIKNFNDTKDDMIKIEVKSTKPIMN